MQEAIPDDKAVAIIERIPGVLANTGGLLMTIRGRVSKFKTYADSLLAVIEASGMDPLLDEKCNQLIANAATAKAEINGQRNPTTQLLAEVTKMFTTAENMIDVSDRTSVIYSIQQHRNKWATSEAERKKREAAAAELQRKKAVAEAELRATMVQNLGRRVNEFLASRKATIVKYFNEITLINIEQRTAWIQTMNTEFSQRQLNELTQCAHPVSLLFSRDEIAAMQLDEEAKYDFTSFYHTYSIELGDLKQELLGKLPGKKAELQEQEENERQRIAKEAEARRVAEDAKKEQDEKRRLYMEAEGQRLAEESDRLNKAADILRQQRREREEQENARIEEERKKRDAAVDVKASVARESGSLNASFLHVIAGDAVASSGPKSKTQVKIYVVHALGWSELFKFWILKEAEAFNKMSPDEVDALSRKELGTLKTYAEKAYSKTGEKIDSKYLQYREETIAKTEKVKKEVQP